MSSTATSKITPKYHWLTSICLINCWFSRENTSFFNTPKSSSCLCVRKIWTLFRHTTAFVLKTALLIQVGFGKLRPSCSITGSVKLTLTRSMSVQANLVQPALDCESNHTRPLSIQFLGNVSKNHSGINIHITTQVLAQSNSSYFSSRPGAVSTVSKFTNLLITNCTVVFFDTLTQRDVAITISCIMSINILPSGVYVELLCFPHHETRELMARQTSFCTPSALVAVSRMILLLECSRTIDTLRLLIEANIIELFIITFTFLRFHSLHDKYWMPLFFCIIFVKVNYGMPDDSVNLEKNSLLRALYFLKTPGSCEL